MHWSTSTPCVYSIKQGISIQNNPQWHTVLSAVRDHAYKSTASICGITSTCTANLQHNDLPWGLNTSGNFRNFFERSHGAGPLRMLPTVCEDTVALVWRPVVLQKYTKINPQHFDKLTTSCTTKPQQIESTEVKQNGMLIIRIPCVIMPCWKMPRPTHLPSPEPSNKPEAAFTSLISSHHYDEMRSDEMRLAMWTLPCLPTSFWNAMKPH